MKKFYFLVVIILTFGSVEANVITGNFSICLPGPTTTQLTGSGIPAPSNPWMSSNPAVATVNATGLVTSVSFGTTTITYTDNLGVSSSENVFVSAFPTITTPFGTLTCAGGTLQLEGSLFANVLTPWTSLTPEIATVDSTGLVAGISGGTATIQYMNLGGCTTTITITINPLLSPIVTCGLTTSTGLTFNWNTVPGASTYVKLYTINGGPFISGGSGSSLTYTISDLCAGDIVDFFVTPSGPLGSCYQMGEASCSTPSLPVADPLDITVCASSLPPYVINIDQNALVLSTIPLADQARYVIKYYENLNDAMNDAPTNIDFVSVGDLAIYQVTVVPKTIYVRIEDLLTKGCYNIRMFVIDVVNGPSGTFSYPHGPYCNNDDALKFPTLFALTSGGTYSATPAGLSINPATGAIDGVASTVGLYSVSYDIAATALCPAFNTTATIEVVGCNCNVIASSASQTVCVNTTITPITYTSSAIATTGSVPIADLPPGITGAFAGNTFTISGTPSTPGVYTFNVTLETGTSDICSIATTIVVNPSATITLTSSPESAFQSVCPNTVITPVVFTTGNGAIGASFISGSVPQGVNAIFSADVLTISGTALEAGTFQYTVSTIGGCDTATFTGVIVVNPVIETVYCDASLATSPNSVYFDWQAILGVTIYNYSYSIGAGPIIIGTTSDSHYEVFDVLPGQLVNFTISDNQSACQSSGQTTCTSLSNEDFQIDSLHYSPNPFSDILNLKFTQPINNIQIFNLLGHQVFMHDFGEKEIQINLSYFSSGTYLVKAKNSDSLRTFKIVKN